MNFIKKVWLSLTILIIASATWGWILASWSISRLAWLFVVASILLLATFLTVPLTNLQRLLLQWFQSDIGTFISVILVAFLFVIFLKWIYFFAKPLVLISATILARLDLLTVGFNKSQTFITLASISLASLGLGAGLNLFLASW
ncbi:MAG: hypothetical protein SXA11_10865 [Cyanobacteriota bacterium]|nr:hypothetical protein [Cyanobacteriota bacterium]